MTNAPTIIGDSPRMRAILEFVDVIADSSASILVTGETGTGKEVLAAYIHERSSRWARPFVPVSCSILSETLIESELFGHERGAFTGAIRDHRGKFERANGGTLFLDDVDDVPLAQQVKLLRVLQERTVEPVGAMRSIPIDVRVIAATKRELKQLVDEGTFREDLYYRLNVIPIRIPPLRERREDIPLLVDHFLNRFHERRHEVAPPVHTKVRKAFMRHDWPGNVRELENVCERIVATDRSGTLALGALYEPELAAGSTEGPAADGPVGERAVVSLDHRLREVELSLLQWALDVTDGNKSKAADLLRLKRSTLRDRLRRHGLNEDDVVQAG